jgi:transcriptional regulator with XRE-family HTH domain
MTTTPQADQPGDTQPRRSIPADTFAARLTLARLHAGHRLSIREAADRCGLNYGTWTGWERGLEPRGLLKVADRISAVLGVDRDWLLFGGPLSEAEENRDRWLRPEAAGSGREGTTVPSRHGAEPRYAYTHLRHKTRSALLHDGALPALAAAA